MRLVQTLNTTSQVVAANDTYNLGIIDRAENVNCACPWYTFNGTSLTINKPGYYDVSVTVNGTGTAGIVGAQLYVNGIASPGAIAETTVAAVGDSVNLSFDKVIRVYNQCCGGSGGPLTLTVVNTGAVDITATSIVLNAIKVG